MKITTAPVRRLVLAGALITALIGAPLAAQATPSPVDGVWRTDGYSTIVHVANGEAQTYHTAGSECVPAEVLTRTGASSGHGSARFEAPGEQPFTISARYGRATMQLDGSVGHRQLQRLSHLPHACTVPAATGPLATFDRFWTTYAENYPFFAAKGIDWDAVRAQYRPQVRPETTDAQLFTLLTRMIAPLGDAHTGIRSPDRSFAGHRPGTVLPDQPLENIIRPHIEQTTLEGRRFTSYANNRIGYADLPGRIGYLRVIAFMGYGSDAPDYAVDRRTLDQTLDRILTAQRTTGRHRLRGLIVDLRLNGGGSDQLALHLAGRLTRHPYFAYAKHARNHVTDPTRFTTPEAAFVRPSTRTTYAGPLVLLTGGSQMSAGETFTMAMANRSPRPVRIGQATQGVFSDTLVRTLPNGWQFALPNEEFRTATWESFDGPGIPPDIRRPVFTAAELDGGRDSAFTTAYHRLR